jgi:hypothetical protein
MTDTLDGMFDKLRDAAATRYDTKLWMRDLMEGAAYLPK